MRALRLAFLAPVLALGVSCGGRTGIELLVSPPGNLFAPADYNLLYVQADAESVYAPVGKFNLFAETPRPYRVYIWAEESPHYKVGVTVELQKDGHMVKSARQANIPLVQGEIVTQPVDFE